MWWEFTLAVTAGAAIVLVPGAAVLSTLRFRGLWLAAGAPAVGVSLVASTAVACGWLGVPFSVWPVFVAAAATALIGWIVARRFPSGPKGFRSSMNRAWYTAASVALGMALLSGRLLFAVKQPDFFAQVGDNVYHLNAIRWILDTADASPLGFGGFGDVQNATTFYPTAWHALSALIAQTTGSSVPVSATATLWVLTCGAWPLAAVLLARSAFGKGRSLLVSAGILSAGFAVYPFQLVPYMGTFPLVGSVPLVGVAMCAAWSACGVGQSRIRRGGAAALLALCVPGVATMHPSALVMLVVLLVPPIAVMAFRVARRQPFRRRLVVLAFALACTLVFAVVLVVRPGYAQELSWRGTVAQSVGEYLLLSLGGQPISVAVGLLVAAGIVRAALRRAPADWVTVTSWATVGLIYVAAAGDDELLRLVASGPWYADATRAAAFAPLAALPLAARGAQFVWASVRAIPLPRQLGGRTVARSGGAAAAIVLLVAVVLSDPGVRAVDRWLGSVYEPTDDPFLSRVAVGPHERAVLEKVEELVPLGDVIAGNPWDGSSFAYALTGRPVVLAHLLAPLTPTERALFDGVSTAEPGDPACQAARELGVKWILEFHPDNLVPTVPRYPGLQNLEKSENVELAFRSGTSSLYELTGCNED